MALVLAVGCAKKVPAPEPAPDPVVTRPARAPGQRLIGTVVAVSIFDERSKVSDEGRLLHMPETTIVGQKDDVFPQLDDAIMDSIRAEASLQVDPGPDEYEVHVYVMEGRQSFRVGEMRESVEARFAVRVEMIDVGNENNIWVGEGRATRSTDAVDVARADVDAIYVEAIRESVRMSFRDLSR